MWLLRRIISVFYLLWLLKNMAARETFLCKAVIMELIQVLLSEDCELCFPGSLIFA